MKTPFIIDSDEEAYAYQDRIHEHDVQMAFYRGLRRRIFKIAYKYQLEPNDFAQEAYEPMMKALRSWDPTRGPWGRHAYMMISSRAHHLMAIERAQRSGVGVQSIRRALADKTALPPRNLISATAYRDEDDNSIDVLRNFGEDPPPFADDVEGLAMLSERWRREQAGSVMSVSGPMQVKPLVKGYIEHVVMGEMTLAAYAKSMGVSSQAVSPKWLQFAREVREAMAPRAQQQENR